MSKFCKEINLILNKLKSGDESLQKDLFNATYNHLKIIALQYAFDKNDYEDILEEAYLRIFKYIKNADLTKDGYNWLCKIVQNVANDFNKKYEKSIPLENITFSNVNEKLEDVIADNDMLLREIEKLAEEDKQILILRFWHDSTIEQIATALNRPKSTIHKRILILIDKITKELKE